MFEMKTLSREWTVGILKRQQAYFGEKFVKQWASVTDGGKNLEPLIETMQEVFEGLNEVEITRGLNTMRTKTFVPSLPEFRSWCRPTSDNDWLSSDEAWAIAIESLDEDKTIVWTEEMAQSFGFVRALLDMGDKFSAARAFKDRYSALVEKAKAKGDKPRMYASLGHNVELREVAVLESLKSGQLQMSDDEVHVTIGYANQQTKPIAKNVLDKLAELRKTLGYTEESMAERLAAQLEEQEAKKQRQIDALKDRIETRFLDPFEDKEDYLDSIRNEPTQQLNYGRINK